MSPDNLDKYVPEFDENSVRAKVADNTRDELVDMLIYAYKEKRVWAKMVGELQQKLSQIEKVLHDPSNLLSMTGIPSADDLRRMMGEDSENP
jgi:hypothetical protein